MTRLSGGYKGSGPTSCRRRRHPGRWFGSPVSSTIPLIYVLLSAGMVTLGLGERVDASVIFGVVLMNAGVGFVQESRAEAALDALRAMVQTGSTSGNAPTARRSRRPGPQRSTCSWRSRCSTSLAAGRSPARRGGSACSASRRARKFDVMTDSFSVQIPLGNVSGGSPRSHRELRSSGSSAWVSSQWMTASNWLVSTASK